MEAMRSHRPAATAQRLAASSSGSSTSPGSWYGAGRPAQRLAASSSGSELPDLEHHLAVGCSTPRGVFVGFGCRCRRFFLRPSAAQRLAASSSGSGEPGGLHDRVLGCSTPRGVFVGRFGRADGREHLHAVYCSTPRCGVFVGFGPRAEGGFSTAWSCSTPRGVFVGFGRSRKPSRPDGSSAQRLRGVSVRFWGWNSTVSRPKKAAQRLAASSSGSDLGSSRNTVEFRCSTPRGVFVGFWAWSAIRMHHRPRRGCSTPRGVFVGFGRGTERPRCPRSRTAQRLAASSSGSAPRAGICTPRLRRNLLNASRRLRRGSG